MKKWKSEIYQRYVSSGQSSFSVSNQGASPVSVTNPFFEHLVKSTLSDELEQSILDIGCGEGSLIRTLNSIGYHNVVGVDISLEQIQVAKKSGLNKVFCEDIFDFLNRTEHTFNTIFLLDILEHLETEESIRLLQILGNKSSESCKIIIQVPNGTGIFGMNVYFGDLTHERAFTSKSLSQLLHLAGFEVEYFRELKPFVHGITSFFRRIIWELGTLPYRLLLASETGHFGHILSQNILVVAKKKTRLEGRVLKNLVK